MRLTKLYLLETPEFTKKFYVHPDKRDLQPGIEWIANNHPMVYDAHTIAKGMNSEALASLDSFLTTDNLNPNRAFHTVVINKPNSAIAAGFGGSEYGPFTSGYAVLLSYPNQMLEQNGKVKIQSVLLAPIWERYLKNFEAKYPNIKFILSSSFDTHKPEPIQQIDKPIQDTGKEQILPPAPPNLFGS